MPCFDGVYIITLPSTKAAVDFSKTEESSWLNGCPMTMVCVVCWKGMPTTVLTWCSSVLLDLPAEWQNMNMTKAWGRWTRNDLNWLIIYALKGIWAELIMHGWTGREKSYNSLETWGFFKYHCESAVQIDVSLSKSPVWWQDKVSHFLDSEWDRIWHFNALWWESKRNLQWEEQPDWKKICWTCRWLQKGERETKGNE